MLLCVIVIVCTFSTVAQILLQGTLHTVLPRIDALRLQLQRRHQLDDMLDRHTVAQHTTNQLGIVPVFGVELLRQALNSNLVATGILKLEVVAFRTVSIDLLDNLTFGD